MKQFQVVKAKFNPKRTDDLVEGAELSIGVEYHWQAVFEIEKGQFVGQWAMMAVDKVAGCLPFAWVPEEDLEIVE